MQPSAYCICSCPGKTKVPSLQFFILCIEKRLKRTPSKTPTKKEKAVTHLWKMKKQEALKYKASRNVCLAGFEPVAFRVGV